MKTFLTALLCVALFPFASTAQNTKLVKMPADKFSVVSKKYPLLSSIETFDATKGGKEPKAFTETYDYRAGSGASLPPSLVDCFIADLMLLYKKDGGTLSLTPNSMPADAAMQAMEVYRKKQANDIIGYRPYTHWKFVRALSAEQQKTLADEVTAYAAEYGVREQ